MKLTTDDLIAALRLRYDYYSAQTMLESALAQAAIPLKDAYDAAEIAMFRAALSRIGDRLAAVDTRLDSLVGSAAPASAAAPSAKPAAPAVASPPAPVPVVAPAKPETVETVETVITLTGVPVDEDEQVLVCGGLPELGDWDVARARPMVREGDRWLAKLELAAGTEAAFKFVRCAPDGSATWEAGANRSLVAVPSIETSWQ
jgi:hypothetical protein